MLGVEFGSGDIASLLVVLVLLFLTAFLAMAETALTRMNRVKASTLKEEGRRGAAVLYRLVEHPERTLNPVLLLILAGADPARPLESAGENALGANLKVDRDRAHPILMRLNPSAYS